MTHQVMGHELAELHQQSVELPMHNLLWQAVEELEFIGFRQCKKQLTLVVDKTCRFTSLGLGRILVIEAALMVIVKKRKRNAKLTDWLG
jgi:hypothetical protein